MGLRASPTVEGALDVMGPVAAKKGLELAYALDPSLPAWIVGDAGRLRQIVLNLLSNAIKFTEAGEVVVRVTGAPVDDRWEIRLAVSDTGMGIPADKIGRLFQSFSQADATISRRYGGTGLGLAISRRLAELMDGSLVAESSGVPGEGTEWDVLYFGRLEALALDADTNAILTNHEALYIHGAKHYLRRHTEEWDQAAEELELFNDAADALNELTKRKMGNAGAAPAYDFGGGGGY